MPVYAPRCAIGNKNVGFGSPARGISMSNMNVKLEGPLRDAIRLKHDSPSVPSSRSFLEPRSQLALGKAVSPKRCFAAPPRAPAQ